MERIKSKLLRIMTATAIVGGGLGISSSTNHSSEVNATNIANTRTGFAVRDLGLDGGVKISYQRTWTDPYDRYEPILMIEVGNSYIPYHSTCNSKLDEYGDNCYYLVPEAKNWSKFNPSGSLADQSVFWKLQTDGSFVRDTGVQRAYFPIILNK